MSHDESFYNFKCHKEAVLRHAEDCDPTMKERMKALSKKNLKKFDYSKTIEYPKFKIQMSFNDFDKNKNFVYEIVRKERDKYNMSDEEKQELVLSRMINDEAKSKLKSIGIKKGKLENNLEDLLKAMEKN